MSGRPDTPAGPNRREFMAGAAAVALAGTASSQPAAPAGIASGDRVFITNEDSNTVSVIDPATMKPDATINLTSFDEDPRPPFRYVTGGVAPTHAAMIHKPLYHGCIDAHGAVPSPDGLLLATAGRGSSNVYLIDASQRRVIGNTPNPAAGSGSVNPECLSSGILVGREPHEPTFTRDGAELWVALRGEDRIAVVDVQRALRQLTAHHDPGPSALRSTFRTLPGPSQVWFSADGSLAYVASQKVAQLEVLRVRGRGQPRRLALLDLSAQDKPGFTPFLKTSPRGGELWLSHKLADAVSCRTADEDAGLLDLVPLGAGTRPNHVEFVANPRGDVVYVSQARVDDREGAAACSRIAIIDRSAPPGRRRVVGHFFSQGREAHGLWTNPEHTLLFVAHEQDELPGTPHAGQTVCSAFDVTDPFVPRLLAVIPLGDLALPSGPLRNKKSINLVYVRPGSRTQSA